MVTIPMVVDAGERGERAYDIFSLLLKNRVVMLGTQVNSQSANLIVAQLLFLDREDSEQRIQMYINSPGGEVYAGMAIYDAMQEVQAPVSTVAVGMTASFGTTVLAAGEPTMRHALPHSTIHMHQPLGGTQGQVSDMKIVVEHYQELKEDLLDIYVQHTGQDRDKLERDMDRDYFMRPQEALEYGLIDSILTRKELRDT